MPQKWCLFQGQHLFEDNIYNLKVGPKLCDNYCITVWNSIIIFHIKLKKLKPYDFDYINNQDSVALIRGWHHLFKWYILFTTPTHPYLQLLTPIDKFLFHSSDMLLYFFHFLFPFLNTQGICQKILKLQSLEYEFQYS